MAGVTVVVSCAKRKTRPPRPRLRAGDLPAGWAAERRAAEWVRRVREESAEEAVSAQALYAGDHWRTALSIASEGASLSVCSAGYGLIGVGSQVAPYDATFTLGEANTVAPRPEQCHWWSGLASWEGPDRGQPRTLEGLARARGGGFLLVALPEAYLAALKQDLIATASLAGDRLGVICAGAKGDAGCRDNMLPCDGRLRGRVGGALASLNVRVARALLRSLGRARPTLERCRAVLTGWMAADGPPPRVTRTSAEDSELMAYVRAALSRDSHASPTALLRCLRQGGRACEQRRFVRLYREARGDHP